MGLGNIKDKEKEILDSIVNNILVYMLYVFVFFNNWVKFDWLEVLLKYLMNLVFMGEFVE